MTQCYPHRTDRARRQRLAESTFGLLAFDTQNLPDETVELPAWIEGVIFEWGVDTERIDACLGAKADTLIPLHRSLTGSSRSARRSVTIASSGGMRPVAAT